MKMKIPSPNSVGNGYYNYEDPFLLDNSNNENGTSTNSNSTDDCDSPTTDGDFSEYLWMENEEEFDKQVLQQLQEEELMEQCIQAMLEDEMTNQELNQWSNLNTSELCNQMNGLRMDKDEAVELAKASKLNPLAAEFVPSTRNVQPSPPVEPPSS